MAKVISVLTAIAAFFCSIFSIPFYANGEKVDLSKFELVFEEQFNGELDKTLWSGIDRLPDGKTTVRRGGYWNNDLAYTENGNLIIKLKYLEDGLDGGGAGWYSAGIDTSTDNINGYEQKYGYFECRCILPKCARSWAAFWLMNYETFNCDGSGEDGTEIDVFESFYYGDFINNKVSSNLYYDGYGEGKQSKGSVKNLVRGNPYEEFNTYGLEWNENEYIFYINGVETYRTDFGGVSKNPEFMLLSIEMGENNEEIPKDLEAEFIVDYVRAYQYK